jgi:ribosomal protein L7/L12
MEPTPDTTNEREEQQVDTIWIVANIFALIALMEDKFGPQAVEQIVAAATAIEDAMRKENSEES